MTGIDAGRPADGDRLEVPLGLTLDLRLPQGDWSLLDVPGEVEVVANEPERLTVLGAGVGQAQLVLADGERRFAVEVAVTEPLMNE